MTAPDQQTAMHFDSDLSGHVLFPNFSTCLRTAVGHTMWTTHEDT